MQHIRLRRCCAGGWLRALLLLSQPSKRNWVEAGFLQLSRWEQHWLRKCYRQLALPSQRNFSLWRPVARPPQQLLPLVLPWSRLRPL
jgi:hypothetical protein